VNFINLEGDEISILSVWGKAFWAFTSVMQEITAKANEQWCPKCAGNQGICWTAGGSDGLGKGGSNHLSFLC
jgi:hypothetical protein